MSTATSIAISSAANAQAAAANAAAQEAARTACMTYVKGYQHDQATVAEMQSYAECIDRLYPQELSADGLAAAKVVIAILLAGVVIGIVHQYRDSYSEGPIEIVFMGSILGLVVSGGGMLLVAGLWFGVRLLLA